jgi:V/A-type H+/Na+-transporting ATPase subunit D
MSGPAVRSRLLTLQQDRQAARLGRALLDSKREAILQELLKRARRRDKLHADVTQALDEARRALREARIEMGSAGIDAAVLAQPVGAAVDVRHGSLVGVPMPRLQSRLKPFNPQFGPAATSSSLDTAGMRFSALVPGLVALAEEEEAVRNLRAGLAKTVRRLKALERVVIPRLERDVRDVAVALEEDERDESVRRKRWVEATRAGESPRRLKEG